MAPPRPTVLVVDADAGCVSILSRHLDAAGFDVVVTSDGEDALARVSAGEPAAVVLDLDLPRLAGIDVCRRVRARSAVPVLVVSARAEEVDTALALELGADGYVVKPASSREVLARVRALVDRSRAAAPHHELPLDHGGLVVDPAAHRVTLDGKAVAVTVKELRLLHSLVRNAGRVVTRRTLIEAAWGTGAPPTSLGGSLDAHVKRLRSKLGERASGGRIVTVRGLGYRFDDH